MARWAALRRAGLAGFVLLLAACIDSSNNDPVVVVFPLNSLDFPLATQVYASDGADLDLSGIAVATNSESVVDQVELSIVDASDADPVTLPPLVNADGSAVFHWRQASLAPEGLPLGLVSVAAVASFGESSNTTSTLVAHGSSWMWQADLQVYVDDSTMPSTSRWFLLDTARRGLLEVDLATGEQSEFSIAGDSNGVDLDRPVDFVIDGSRALVVDRQLGAIIAIDLASGARSIFSGASVPNSTPPLISDPVAIAIDASSAVAYVVERGAQ